MAKPQFIPMPERLEVSYDDFMRAGADGKCPACGEPIEIQREQLKYPAVDGSRYIYAGQKVALICETGKHYASRIVR